MKKLSLLLAILMMFSCIGGAFAEEPAVTETELLAQDCAYSVIEADEVTGQVKLSYMEGVTTILEVDGLKFKDLNKNGVLDVYEDWRQEADARLNDLVSQMTEEELIGDMLCINADLEQARSIISDFKMNCLLFNLNGTPITITNTLNNLQAKAEGERLGIPMIITSDREYNSFGGYIDKSHEAFGTAYDPELAYQLASFYGKAMTAIGVHVTFEPYAEEIGAQYGENPDLIAAVVHEEIRGLEDNGLASCAKHWIGRGGDSNFGNARSVAQNFDNWMVGWKAALSAGAEWVMTNCAGTGITNTCDVKWDKVTMSYLRDTLGFDGIVVTDWWPFGFGAKVTGITPDGVDLAEQSYCWLFNDAVKNGVDMFGTPNITHGSVDYTSMMTHYPDDLVAGLKSGEIEKDIVENAVKRINRFRITKGLFEDPYNDVNAAVALCASAEWAANPTEIHSNEDLRAARNPEEVALTEKLQAESAVLVKNDNNLLPLSKDIKVYFESPNAARNTSYSKYIANFATIVGSMEEADVLVGDFSSIDDATELFIEDAIASEKPIVLTLNNLDPDQYTLENADAIIYMSYNQQADHGSSEAGFITATEPWIYADLLFGEKTPGGVIVKEIARNSFSDDAQWKDLAGDQGASSYVRLMVQATMMADTEKHASPNNWGDPLVQALYGMKYGENPEFVYSCFILPVVQTEQEEEDSSGNKSMVIYSSQAAKVGEPFTVYCLLNNNGADGITTVQVKDGDKVVAEKIMTVTAGSWRVVEMEVTLDTVGEHTLTMGDQVGTITITE
jgi:beta-glucosidase-like glycosyl hydrolase